MFSFTTAEVATSLWRVIAPITIERPFSSIPDSSPSIALRSIRLLGDASRSFMVGISVCPPARIFASSSLPSMFEAWRRPVGRWNSKLYILALLNVPCPFSAPHPEERPRRVSKDGRSPRPSRRRAPHGSSGQGPSSFRRLAAIGLLQRRPHRRGRGRHCDVFRSDRVGDGVHHRGRRRDRARFAAALDAERIRRTLRLGGVDLE